MTTLETKLKYRIRIVPYNIILEERKKTAKGEEVWDILGYFSNVKSCLDYLFNLGLRGTDFKTLLTSVNGALETVKAVAQQLEADLGGKIQELKDRDPVEKVKIEKVVKEKPPVDPDLPKKKRGRPKKSNEELVSDLFKKGRTGVRRKK